MAGHYLGEGRQTILSTSYLYDTIEKGRKEVGSRRENNSCRFGGYIETKSSVYAYTRMYGLEIRRIRI